MSATDRIQQLSLLFVAVSVMLLFVRLAYWVSYHAVNIVFWDQWDFYGPMFENGGWWQMFLFQHGPHRQGLGTIVTSVIAQITAWNTRAESFSLMTMVFLAMLIGFFIKRRLTNTVSPSDVIIPLIFLTTVQYETFIGTPNPAHAALPLLLIMAYVFSWTSSRIYVKYTLVLIINALLIYTGFGVFMGVVTIGILFIVCCRLAVERQFYYLAGSFAALALAVISLYSFTIGYSFNSAVDCFVFPYPKFWEYAIFVALMFSNFLGVTYTSLPVAATLVGLVLLTAGLVVFAVHVYYLFTRSLRQNLTSLAVVVLVGFSLVFCLNSAIGRVCTGLQNAQASRYTTLLIPAFFGMYLHCCTMYRTTLRRFFTVGLAIVLLPSLILLAPETDPISNFYSVGKQRWKECYLEQENIEQCNTSTGFQIYPSPEKTRLAEKLMFLKEHNYNLYSGNQTPYSVFFFALNGLAGVATFLQFSRSIVGQRRDDQVARENKDGSLPIPFVVAEQSNDLAISVRQVSKRYHIYNRPQDRLKQMLVRGRRAYGREFWALRDISFEVKRGETVGIIGRNGSGKSTLLQIITGTLTPTAGEVTVQGRVAALLELGSGFNPEFTGRENVFLNGAILGFTREQIEQRFDEIAAFADIGDFIDQPVKLYSSGMLVRLAFAVQSCVEPNVLIVDEALAVGDLFFQQKCYRRIEELRSRGTSILFVSHNMSDVRQFCQRAIYLEDGTVKFQGSASDAVSQYMLQQQSRQADVVDTHTPQHTVREAVGSIMITWPSAQEAFFDLSAVQQVSSGVARCTAAALCDTYNRPRRVFEQGETARLLYEFELLADINVPIGGYNIENEKSIIVHGKNTLQYNDIPTAQSVKKGQRIRFQHDLTLNVATGEYTIEIGLASTDLKTFLQRDSFAADDLYSRVTRICHLNPAGRFAVVSPGEGQVALPLHFGVANLPGEHTFQLCG